MTDINYKGILWGFAIAFLLCLLVGAMVANAGCLTAVKKIGKDALATPTPTPTPVPTTLPTPTPTPTPIPTVPTIAAHFVDPYIPGERWEGQWYKWNRNDVQGLKDLNVGIIAYRHKFMDKYTWYNNAIGQYMSQYPGEGKRYFVVWIHQEMFGNSSESDPSMWLFDETAFRLQAKGNLIGVDTIHNPVNIIKEFERYPDFYNAEIARQFPYTPRYVGQSSPEAGGYSAIRQVWLRMGKGNAVDGYMIYEIPKETKEEEILLLGSFSQFGNAYWRFIE